MSRIFSVVLSMERNCHNLVEKVSLKWFVLFVCVCGCQFKAFWNERILSIFCCMKVHYKYCKNWTSVLQKNISNFFSYYLFIYLPLCLYLKVLPKWVVYHELVLTTKEYMRQVFSTFKLFKRFMTFFNECLGIAETVYSYCRSRS